jgi:hypothetical protein
VEAHPESELHLQSLGDVNDSGLGRLLHQDLLESGQQYALLPPHPVVEVNRQVEVEYRLELAQALPRQQQVQVQVHVLQKASVAETQMVMLVAPQMGMSVEQHQEN